jgi:hypothetical protein
MNMRGETMRSAAALLLAGAFASGGCSEGVIEMADKTARVAWKVRATGHEGIGEPVSVRTAKAWVDYENKKYRGEIDHWVVYEDKDVKLAGRE